MANFDNLMQGLKMFQQGVQEFATNRAVSDATEQIHQLNASQMDEMQKRAATQQLANDMALRLTAIGTPASTIQTAFSAAAPKALNSPDQYILEGLAKNSQAMQDIGVKAQTMDPDYILKKQQAEYYHEAQMASAEARKTAAEDKRTQQVTTVKNDMSKVFYRENKNILDGIDAANQAKSLLDKSKDPAAIGMSVRLLAKASGDARVSDQDAEAVATNPSYASGIARKVAAKLGNTSLKDDREAYKYIIGVLEDSARQRMKVKAHGFASGIAKNNKGVDPLEYAQSLLEKQGLDSSAMETKPMLTPEDQGMMDFLNNPANQKHPNYSKWQEIAKRKGLIP